MSRQAQRLIGVTMVTASLLAVAAADVILEYDTGHPLGPHFLTLDEETPLEISVTDRTGEQWGIGAVYFGFAAPAEGLSWDLNGFDDTDFTEDDDFVWVNGFGGALDPNGDPLYYGTVDPSRTFYADFSAACAFQVPPNGTVSLAALSLRPTHVGGVVLEADESREGIFWDAETFLQHVIEDGTERVTLTVLPRADGDGDADIDLTDFAIFQACFTGSGPSGVEGVCTLFDFDSDDDIDLDDFAVFRDAVTGPYA